MGKKKIISFDLDITLLNHADYKVPDSALLAIEKMKEAGHVIAISTGRDMENYHGRPFVELIRPHALIQLNGTKVTADGKVLHSHLFDKELLKRLVDFCLEKGYPFGVTVGDEDYYFHEDKVRKNDIRRWGASYRNFQDPYRMLDMEIRTLAYVGDDQGAMDIEAHFPTLKLPLFAGMRGADIIERGHSKAKGLKVLSRYYRIPMEDTVAFGDSMNDLEILEEAGIGVAMGNALEILKDHADFVTDDIDKNGIFNACKRLSLFS